MFRLSQFAAPAIVGAALFAGAGCASERPDEVPGNASLISEGTKNVVATAPHDGEVYVWDKTADKMVYSGKVQRGDTVRVDAKHNKFYVNDKLAVERDLTDDHNYRVFFDQADVDQADLARHRDTTIITTPGSDGGNVIVQPAQPAPAQPNTTVITPAPAQPQSNTTVITPAPSNKSDTTIVHPDGSIERR
jgi:hypothetical protein